MVNQYRLNNPSGSERDITKKTEILHVINAFSLFSKNPNQEYSNLAAKIKAFSQEPGFENNKTLAFVGYLAKRADTEQRLLKQINTLEKTTSPKTKIAEINTLRSLLDLDRTDVYATIDGHTSNLANRIKELEKIDAFVDGGCIDYAPSPSGSSLVEKELLQLGYVDALATTKAMFNTSHDGELRKVVASIENPPTMSFLSVKNRIR